MDFIEIFKKLIKKLKPGFRKLKRIMALLAVLVIVVTAAVFLLTRVRNVTYVGDAPYTADEIKANCGAAMGKNIFFVDLDKLTTELEKSMPYLNNVKVSRKLPWTLKVDGDRSLKTYAVVVSKGSYAVTNNNMKVLENTNQITNNLIYVVRNDGFWTYSVGERISFLSAEQAEEDDVNKVDHIQDFLSQLPEAMEETGLRDIGMIFVDSSTDISMVYQNRILIRMGDSSNVAGKIKVAMKIISEEDEMSISQCGILNVIYSAKGVFSPADYSDIPELEQLAEIQKEQQELADFIEKQKSESVEPQGEPVTDENGEPVTDENGEQVTEVPTDANGEPVTKNDVATTVSNQGENSASENEKTTEKVEKDVTSKSLVTAENKSA